MDGVSYLSNIAVLAGENDQKRKEQEEGIGFFFECGLFGE